MTCAFSGHRPQRLPWGGREEDERCLALKQKLKQELEALCAQGCGVFLCGMAMGCDTYFAEGVLALRRTWPGVSLCAVLPCRNQADRWPAEDRARWEALLAACDQTVVLQESYSPHCMQRRNAWMLDHADCLMTVYDGGPGGTAWTVRDARRRGIPLIPLWL